MQTPAKKEIVSAKQTPKSTKKFVASSSKHQVEEEDDDESWKNEKLGGKKGAKQAKKQP